MDKKLIDKVNDGFNYFNSGILEELTTDKKYYVQSFMDYIEQLEKRTQDFQISIADKDMRIDILNHKLTKTKKPK